ncbi:hypothetical protein [Fictibacillus sp. FJAT-27399]|uniref:hypothetical protein n=1 Tax=Fictibacillus sp. FJAT-27399 TaxID=1729689 RepID=UPI0012E35B1A|nr:hypothetical protein [Fictibacillus sp. FJAT-27399]
MISVSGCSLSAGRAGSLTGAGAYFTGASTYFLGAGACGSHLSRSSRRVSHLALQSTCQRRLFTIRFPKQQSFRKEPILKSGAAHTR